MNLPALCIRRPAFTIVISLIMTIIGLIGFSNLPVRWIPNVSQPQVYIETSYPGANARLVEQEVTKRIEEQLSGLNGVESMTSTSKQGESFVNLTFQLGRNMDTSVEDVRSSIERVRGSLPRDVQSPIVMKADPNNNAIMYLSFNDKNRSSQELSDYIDKFVKPVFENIDGIGNVYMYGGRISAMHIRLDPQKMAAAKVTVDEVVQLLQEQNASIPSGQIRGADRYYSIVTDTGLKNADQFNNLIIRDNQHQTVRLKDIGEAKLDPETTDSAFRVNGSPGIALGIVPQSTANPLDVERGVQKAFASIKRTLPAGMEASVIFNQADYIRASIHSVYEAFGEAILFVWLVILAFLCNFRATLIPIITVPVCVIASFAILYFFGFSINTITLMAFVLAIGLVVDDAIVMLENISRYIEGGMRPYQAALKGSGEIVFPIIAMTLTLVAVYTPIAFTPGLLGVLFREFTFSLAGAVLISGIVALTLSPMMCSRFLRPTHSGGRYSIWLAQAMQRLQNGYSAILHLLLNKRAWVVVVMLAIGGLGGLMYKYMSSELAPQEDMSEMYVSIAAPRNSSFVYTDQYTRQLEGLYRQYPDILHFMTMNHSGNPAHAFQLLMLKPKKEREQSLASLMTSLTAETAKITGVRVNVFPPSSPLAEYAGGDDGDNIGLVMMTTSDYRKLQQTSAHIMDLIKEDPKFVHVDNSLKWDSAQFQISIDRDRAADLRMPVANITNTISTLIAGRNIGKLDDANIIVQMNQDALANPNVLQQIYARNLDNVMVPVSSLLSINEISSPEVFRHYERMRADTIYMSLAPNLKMADAIKNVQAIVKDNLPDDTKFSFTGEAKSFMDSNKTALTFLLALIFIYLVLVAQFESFIDPLIIMFTVPFAIVGALLTLKLFGGSLNIYSNIGLITLIGLISKHGILITDFANRLRAEGKNIREAITEAAKLRLRPILMTTSAMILGALPLALASGPGAESRQQIGLVVAGGLLFGTFFSLIVVPIAYSYLSPLRKDAIIHQNQETADASII